MMMMIIVVIMELINVNSRQQSLKLFKSGRKPLLRFL